MSEIKSTLNPALTGGFGRSEAFEIYGKAASEAARTLDYQKAGQEALAGLMSVKYDGEHGKSNAVAGRPQLYPPLARPTEKESDADLFTLLMAMISELLGEVDVNKLKNRLAMLQSMAGAKQQGYEKLAAEYAAAVAALEAAEGTVGGSQAQLEKLRERVQQVQGLLDESEARLARLDPESPEYASELARRDQLKGELTGVTQTLQKASEAHLKLIETANAAAKVLAAVTGKVVEAGLDHPPIRQTDEKALSSSALALLNRLKIIELLGETAQNEEALNQQLFQELQAKLQEKMQRESDKYLEEVRKAEALQKTMGCIGKLVGALVSIATVVAGVLTANPVLIAVGVIGAAVMIADEVVKELTGTSFMAEVMKPLMSVMQEAIKLFAALYTQALMAFGVDAETAKDIGQIAGMIAGIAATVAAIALAAVVGVQVVGPMIGTVASKLASVVAQAAPAAVQAMKQLASSVGNTLTQMLSQLRSFITRGADSVTVARFAARLEMAQALTEGFGVGAQGVLGVRSGVHQSQAAEALADVRVRMAISEEITAYLTQLVENYGKAMQDRARQIEHVFADLQGSHNARVQIARRV
ncbi:type III secretion system translocon subunit SctE [Pseudomonas sp. 14P_8.1_Bac3]|uniref:type III secretion system translocon subunit SctE n=1 Tax=Pseudomonas sp. 14P_8.1_Bac3 TaxID=2971621 RepID=UPI0021C762C8|nr:type III secretion system translocon subunit SctE [Pseudomonas sp. 14P_8.1_Bac3]MCU1761470.1 type III secretion system translocon subunit SctE [Pseudomonas sp. 14P_8.1_Bac3]